MKKKLFLAFLLSMALVCLFAITAFAANQSYYSYEVVTDAGQTVTVYGAKNFDKYQGRAGVYDTLYTEPCLDSEGTYATIDTLTIVKIDFTNAKTYEWVNEAYIEREYGSTSKTIYAMGSGTPANFANVKEINFGKAAMVSGFCQKWQGLEKVTFPMLVQDDHDRNVSFSSDTFRGCTNLKTIEFADDTTFTVGGQWVFAGTAITSIDLSIFAGTYIYANMFNGCTSLKSIVVPNGLTKIDANAFYNCTSLTSVTIPTTVTEINNGAFQNCSSLTNFTIHEGVTKLGSSVFNGCTGLTSIYIPASVTSIGSDCWRGCSGVTKVTFNPNCKVTWIGPHTFEKVAATEITFPNSVTQISQSTFNSCPNLTTVKLGASFLNFNGSNAGQPPFTGAEKIQYIYLSDTFTSAGVRNCIFTWNDNNANEYNNKYYNLTIFFTGTKAQAQAILDAANGDYVVAEDGTTTGARVNTYIGTMKLISAIDYAKAVKDGTLVEGVKGTPARYFVYDYSSCEAFYEGVHQEQAPYDAFKGDKYVTDYCTFAGCSRCPKVVETKIHGPLFISKGYSKTTDAFMFDMKVDFEAIEIFESLGGTVPSYGLVVSGNAGLTKLLNADGTVIDNSVLKVNFDESGYTNVQVRLNNITTPQSQAMKVHVCAYIIDANSVKYVGNGKVTTDDSTLIAYEDIKGEEDDTTQGGETPEVDPAE